MNLLNLSPNGLNPIAFSIGEFEVAWYGIIIFISFITSAFFAFSKAHFWYKVPIEPMLYFAFLAIPLSIFGARIWSVVIGDAVVNNINDFFNFKNGGLAIHGGILASIGAALIFFPLILKSPKYHVKTLANETTSIKRISSFVYADLAIPCIMIGQVIGRWGNFINGEVYGSTATPEQLSWLRSFMPLVYQGMHINGVLHQPLFLYESFANFIIFIFLYVALEFINKRKAGDMAAGYFIGYGLVRLIMEPLRFADFEFVTSIVISVLMFIGGVLFVLYNHLYLSKHREDFILYKILKYSEIPFKWLFSKINLSYKKDIIRYDPQWENWGNPKPLKLKRSTQEMMYYNGI